MTEIQLLRQDMDISRAIMLTTIFVAITSIVFSSITMAFERSYNVKSLRPFFNLNRTVTVNSISLSIMNSGLGPMLITSIGLIKGQAEDNILALGDVLSSYMDNEKIFNHFDDYALASKEEIQLFQFTGTGRNPSSELQNLKDLLKEYLLYVEYKDVYGHKYQKTVTIPH